MAGATGAASRWARRSLAACASWPVPRRAIPGAAPCAGRAGRGSGRRRFLADAGARLGRSGASPAWPCRPRHRQLPASSGISAAEGADRLRPSGAPGGARRVGTRGSGVGCVRMRQAAWDPAPHVALLALDLLASCAVDPLAAAALIQASRPAPGATWHRAAHALVSLARLAPAAARPLLSPAMAHPVWQVRAYAARRSGFARHDGAGATGRRFERQRAGGGGDGAARDGGPSRRFPVPRPASRGGITSWC